MRITISMKMGSMPEPQDNWKNERRNPNPHDPRAGDRFDQITGFFLFCLELTEWANFLDFNENLGILA